VTASEPPFLGASLLRGRRRPWQVYRIFGPAAFLHPERSLGFLSEAGGVRLSAQGLRTRIPGKSFSSKVIIGVPARSGNEKRYRSEECAKNGRDRVLPLRDEAVLAFTDPFHRAVYLTGPTASGKTAVGIELARLLDAEIVALDSMTLYREMDIGTAKPTIAERQEVAHHLIDVLDPWEAASVAQYRTLAAKAVDGIEARGKRALFVGGAGLHLKALLRGLFEGPGADADIRNQLEDDAMRSGDAAIHARLAAVDPSTAARLHPNDRRRVIRALEVALLTGRPLSEFQQGHERAAPSGVAVFALARPREELRDRIDRRVVAMFEEGLVEEVSRLTAGPKPLHLVPAQGVGYREVIDLIAGRLTESQAIEQIQARTRQFAKRQRTWFRGLAEVQTWPIQGDEPPEETAQRLAAHIVGAN
jgi:tRNA dimethylallyltransferase